MVTSPSLHPPPTDATLTVTRAARVLGVHPNTVRAWSDAGRLRYYRINARGDRRYRIGDLNRFLAGAAEGPDPDASAAARPRHTRRTGAPVGAVAQGAGREAPQPRPGAVPLIGDLETPADSPSIDARSASAVLSGLTEVAASLAGSAPDVDAILGMTTRVIREGAGFHHVSIWRRTQSRLDPIGVSGPSVARVGPTDAHGAPFHRALSTPGSVTISPWAEEPPSLRALRGARLTCTIPAAGGPWGVLLAVTRDGIEPDDSTRELVASVAEAVGSIIRASHAASALDHRLHWAEALGRVAVDIGSRLEPDLLLGRLVDHAIAMFGGDRAAVFLFEADGSRRTVASHGLSTTYLTALSPGDLGSLTTAAIAARRPMFVAGFRDDPRAAEVRASVVQEGYDTICVAPLIDFETGEAIGSLNVYHDRRHDWTHDEASVLGQLADQAAVAIRSARTYAQLATWAAQLQSIQQLGARLNRLSDVEAIGAAIATELRDLIDYHNVRVYRQYGDDLVPVAMRGQVGEYVDETPDQLRVKVGVGITGWVAQHRIAESLPDAAADPRADTIPGTEPDFDESMLLAPMVFEDECLGVVVLSKLGLHQFTDDDLRLLVIYASFAAQAMAHADATQRLERQLQSRRDLLQVTETILGTLDTAAVLDSVAERLGELVRSDNLWIELLDEDGQGLIPVMAKGQQAEAYMEPYLPGEAGLGTWVMDHNEAALVPDQFDDPRVLVGPDGPVHGGLICVPLRGRGGAIGILTLERLGEHTSFTEDEFELVQLFGAQVSVAVQNARAHGAITLQAETDDLTGLRNHRSFRRQLAAAVAAGDPFSLLMVDLDRFKLINDNFGHGAGNGFLQAIARAIVAASRDTDTAFRYGGDEFVVLLSGTDAEHVGPVADRIRQAFASVAGPTPEMQAKGIHVDASAGVATYPIDGTTPEAILLAADRACFMAKRDGGGRVATAAEGLALAGDFTLQVPTPIDTGS